MIKTIGIIGVGGVGGYFGGKLCQLLQSTLGLNIYFIARGTHLEKIRKKGLYLRTEQEEDFICRPTLATDRFDDLPVLDLCLLCVKSYDLATVLEHLHSCLSPKTCIIPLLNGIDIYERIRDVITSSFVFPACVYIGTRIEDYGRVTQLGGACKILFGKDPLHPEVIPREVFDLFERGHIKYAWFDNASLEIWKKYLFIAAFGMVSAGFGKTIGQIMESEELSHTILSIMKEIAAISDKKGIVLSDTMIHASFDKGHDFPHETKTSFQRDIEDSNKPDERDLFGGTILRLSRSFGTDAQVTRMVHEKIQGIKPRESR